MALNDEEKTTGEDREDLHRVYEWRYRTSKYFLEDQLRVSEAAQDFRSVKKLLASAPQFNLRGTYQFARVTVRANETEPPRKPKR